MCAMQRKLLLHNMVGMEKQIACLNLFQSKENFTLYRHSQHNLDFLQKYFHCLFEKYR